jgi:MATE family multidrug resistance protein
MISHAFWSLQHFIDRMYLLWYDTDAMAAALPAGMLHWTLVSFPLGIASFTNTFVAQYCGAGHEERVGRVIRQGLLFGLAMAPLLLLVNPLAPMFFGWVETNPKMLDLETRYFQILSYGAGAMVLSAALSAFFTGRGETTVVMVVNCMGTFVNAFLDYAWVFGELGFPKSGIDGAAWATVVANWFNAGVFALWMLRPAYRKRFGMFAGSLFDWPLLRRLLHYGVPGGVNMVAEGIAFTIAIFFISSLSTDAAAATTIAFNINAVAFIPLFGLSIAISTLVGTQLGADRDDLAARATWNGMLLGWLYTGGFAIAYVGMPDLLMAAHAEHADPEKFAQLREPVIVLLRFAAAYAFFDATQIIFVGALRGAGDTRFILAATVGVGTTAVVFGRYAQAAWNWQLIGWWWVITLWIAALAVLYTWRFLQGKWRSMRVIEPNLLDLEQIEGDRTIRPGENDPARSVVSGVSD